MIVLLTFAKIVISAFYLAAILKFKENCAANKTVAKSG